MKNRRTTILTTTFSLWCVVAPSAAGQIVSLETTEFRAMGETVSAVAGRLKVPENRSNPDTRMIEIAFVRFSATTNTPGPPIVYLAGGPGVSGIGTAKGRRFRLFNALRQVGDVIVVDQRGVGDSTPSLDCDERIDLPMREPASRESYLAAIEKACLDPKAARSAPFS